jgi:hypothetical protein
MKTATFADFCKVHDITAKSIEAAPTSEDAKDYPGGHHYMVTLSRPGHKMLTTEYHMGSALTHRPKASEVLWSLVQDAEGYHNARDFEDWAGEYGYDSDSRTAERTYRQVEKLTNKLHDFLGELYQEAAEIEE